MRLTVFSRHLFQSIGLCLMIALLGGCGIKPSHVDPPQGEKHDTFPRTYPDPALDPAPERLIR